MNIQTDIKQFSSPLYLESGRILEPYQIAYESYGEINSDKSNVILICHALSGSHHASGTYDGDSKLVGGTDLLEMVRLLILPNILLSPPM